MKIFPQNNSLPVPSRKELTEILIETLIENEEQLDTTLERELVLFRDHTNQEGYIVNVIVDVCKLYEDEATECVKEANYKGHSTLTKGTFNELRPLRNRMRDRKVWTEIL